MTKHSTPQRYRLFQIIIASVWAGIACLHTGCSTTLARIDQHNLRGGMMRYQEDQILDNLIRVKNNYPIAHFDIDRMDAAVETALASNLSGGQTITNAATGLMSAVRPFTFFFNPSRKNTITVSVKAVTQSNEVYAAYTYFVKDLDGLEVREPSDRPSEEEVLLGAVWWRDGKYYFVPKSKGEAFFKLALRVTVARGVIKGAATPLELQASSRPSGGTSGRKKRSVTPLDAPSVTTPDQREGSGIRALEDAADELRKLRLLR